MIPVTDQYLDRLMRAHPGIAEVWLFGSRADGKLRADSDWDYMVFLNDQREFNEICQDRELNRPEVDLFVVIGSRAIRPWPARYGQNKVLLLDASPEGMHWTSHGVTATYQSREEQSRGSPSFETILCTRLARRVRPEPLT